MKRTKAKTRLIRYTDAPGEVIASAAKLCYAKDTKMILSQDPGQVEKFVGVLRDMGHMSPVEHASFTFYIEGVSRAMTHQLVRHRLASYSQRSQRYVRHDGFEYVIPPQFKGKKVKENSAEIDAEEYFRETMAYLARRYAKLNEVLGDSGESSNEDARYVLPNACETKIFVTMNARALLHFFEERLCLRAQWEIRGVADQMLMLVREVCPSVFEGAGPKCVRLGKCPEGKMTCGKFEKIKKRYAA
ncbi:MAG TPA: FAD-dependent thymidylate synthase [Deltaproteobacteria bacterium]|nr:FAD-dependent thymidylate synthase [Deltaproteobacteria bacterium]HDH97513.1 FAD-dependent thymidylate synthase [Deltaproteobacteria bacterium]